MHESSYIDHKAFHRRLMMISSDRVVESFPQPFDFIDPWMIDRLREQLELGVVGKPALRDVAFMDHERIDDEHDSPGAAISTLDFVQQVNEQQGVFSFTFGPYHLAAVRQYLRTTRANVEPTNVQHAAAARLSPRSCPSPTATRSDALGGFVHLAFGSAFSNGVSLGVGSSVHCVASGGLFGGRNGCGYPI